MTVSELIKKLSKMPPTAKVRIAFDMGVRMDVEVVKDVGVALDPDDMKVKGIVVLTDEREWDDREHW